MRLNESGTPARFILDDAENSNVKYWWVNQNQTYSEEIDGEFLWSPKKKKNDARNPFYDFMTKVRAGDVVFSFKETRIKAIGVAKGSATSSPKPTFVKAGANWSDEGWFVPMAFFELNHPIRPKDHIEKLRPLLPEKYSPLRANGNGLESVYLTQVPDLLAKTLVDLIGMEFLAVRDLASDVRQEIACLEIEDGINDRTDIGPTTKEQLVRSRRGQGIFRIKVRRIEKACRVTGVTDPRNLRASHIKPWKDCSDQERLSGYNGLMLAPHVDHLFDKGFISFSDEGDLIISPKLDRSVLGKWGISEVLNVGQFKEQKQFLAYHRAYVLKR